MVRRSSVPGIGRRWRIMRQPWWVPMFFVGCSRARQLFFALLARFRDRGAFNTVSIIRILPVTIGVTVGRQRNLWRISAMERGWRKEPSRAPGIIGPSMWAATRPSKMSMLVTVRWRMWSIVSPVGRGGRNSGRCSRGSPPCFLRFAAYSGSCFGLTGSSSGEGNKWVCAFRAGGMSSHLRQRSFACRGIFFALSRLTL